jgi:hypothetical protein
MTVRRRVGILGRSDRDQTLTGALTEACEAAARVRGAPVSPLTRQVLASRLSAYAASGEEDPAKWLRFALGGFQDLLGSAALTKEMDLSSTAVAFAAAPYVHSKLS